MAGGLGPRFALEASFLIALAAVAAYARLSAAEIIAVMAAGWFLTALFEAIAATRERLYARTRWERRVEEAPAAVKPEPEPEPVAEAEPKRRRSWIGRRSEPEAEAEAGVGAPAASSRPVQPAPATPPALARPPAEPAQPAPATPPASSRPPTEPHRLAERPAAASPPTTEQAPDEPPASAAPPDKDRPPVEATAGAGPPVEREAAAAAAAAGQAPPAGVRPEAPVRAGAPAAEPVREGEGTPPARAESSSDDEATGEFERPAQGPRRWLRRRQAEPTPPPEPEPSLEPARPSARHVRLIRRTPNAAPEGTTTGADADDRKDADTAP